MSKNLEIVIGPNGFGKTTYLIDEIKNHKKEECFLLNSEIKTEEELKDSKDSSRSMEFFIDEILISADYDSAKNNLIGEIQKCIDNKKSDLNSIFENALSFNKNIRAEDFIAANNNLTIKKPIEIDKEEIGKMGSGQRMLLLLKLSELSERQYIFLDEPEAHSHPSMLHEIANTINNLVSHDKKVYIATHSPLLVSLLDFDFENLKIINDSSHTPKILNFKDALDDAVKLKIDIGDLSDVYKKYYKDEKTLKDNIKINHLHDFLYSLFAQKVYMCEGIYDEAYIHQSLEINHKLKDDFYIFKTFGKFPMLILIILLKQINDNVVAIFDSDSDSSNKKLHEVFNNALNDVCCKRTYIFEPNIESKLGYSKKDKNDKFNFIEYMKTSAVKIDDISAL